MLYTINLCEFDNLVKGFFNYHQLMLTAYQLRPKV